MESRGSSPILRRSGTSSWEEGQIARTNREGLPHVVRADESDLGLATDDVDQLGGIRVPVRLAHTARVNIQREEADAVEAGQFLAAHVDLCAALIDHGLEVMEVERVGLGRCGRSLERRVEEVTVWHAEAWPDAPRPTSGNAW